MNFLAHIYLSGDNSQLMIGNFIGDFVKGGDLTPYYDAEIIRGVDLHRAIDEFTDRHEVVQSSKDRLRPKYRHYSGVIVDMYYDHFLAKNWIEYHDMPLLHFTNQFYELIKTNEDRLPSGVKKMMPYMKQSNWLLNYAEVEGIHRALAGMSRRTKFDSKMDEAVVDLTKHYSLFENEFKEFFPILKKFSETWIATH